MKYYFNHLPLLHLGVESNEEYKAPEQNLGSPPVYVGVTDIKTPIYKVHPEGLEPPAY